MKTRPIRLTPETDDLLTLIAAELGTTRQFIAEAFLRSMLDEMQKDPDRLWGWYRVAGKPDWRGTVQQKTHDKWQAPLVLAGRLRVSREGEKPQGGTLMPALPGKPVSEMIIEARRFFDNDYDFDEFRDAHREKYNES